MQKWAILACLLGLGACATEADDYGGSPKAQADLAKCRAQSDSSPALTNAQANPIFAAAMQQQFVQDCMKAAGWR